MFKTMIQAGILTTSMAIMSTSVLAQNWVLTPKSTIDFDIKSAGMSIVKGTFQKYQSQMTFDPANLNKASVKFVLDVNSLSFSKPSLKSMIMGESFFHADQYKTVTFQGSQVKPLGNNKYSFVGNLTLRGVTKPVTFDTTLKANAANPKLLDVHSTTVINRSDFGMRKAVGGVGEKVYITLSGQWQAK